MSNYKKIYTLKNYTASRLLKDGGTQYGGDDNFTVSDGYHTMDELYEHRIALWINLCYTYFCLGKVAGKKAKTMKVWRSQTHSDGTSILEYFVLGIGTEKGEQITYHLSMDYWNECDFAETLEKAPEFDGHTSKDVIERLKVK